MQTYTCGSFNSNYNNNIQIGIFVAVCRCVYPSTAERCKKKIAIKQRSHAVCAPLCKVKIFQTVSMFSLVRIASPWHTCTRTHTHTYASKLHEQIKNKPKNSYVNFLFLVVVSDVAQILATHNNRTCAALRVCFTLVAAFFLLFVRIKKLLMWLSGVFPHSLLATTTSS